MRRNRDVLGELCRNGASIDDVLVVVRDQYRNVYGEFGRPYMNYARNEGEVDLRVEYKDGEIYSIEVGQHFHEATYQQLLDRIQTEVVDSPGTIIARDYIFCEIPVNGYWRRGQDFQLLPPSPNAPQPLGWLAPHPFRLEFSLRTSSNPIVNVYRRQRRVDRIVNRLGALCNARVWSEPRRPNMHWVLVKGNPDTVQCCQPYFSVPQDEVDTEDWTVVRDIEPMDNLSPCEYYKSRLHHVAECLRLPTTANQFFEAVGNLDKADSLRFGKACYWINHAEAVTNLSDSAAFIALVTTIESLLPDTQPIPCEKCGRNVGPGPTQKFQAFLDDFLSDGVRLHSSKRQLYALRSSVTHGGRVFSFDLDAFHMMHPDKFHQWKDLDDMKCVAHGVLHNWVLHHKS